MAKKPDLKLVDWISKKNRLSPKQRDILHDWMEDSKNGPADSVDPKKIDEFAKEIKNEYPRK